MGTDNFNFTSYHAGHKHAVETISLNGTPYNYTYDNNGNMTSGPDFTDTSQVGDRTISYNADNMPTQVTSVRGGDTTTVNYEYDGFGQRYKKEVVGGVTTYYISDSFEIKGGTAVKYIFAGNLRVAQVEGSTLSYMHKDHLGSSSVMTDDSGVETESTQYMPFGSTRPGSGEITGTSYGFTDQEFDTENGLYNYGARLYDPVIGRFISADTVVPQPFNPQSLNRYTYCLNNPLIYVDPSGHVWDDVNKEYLLEDFFVTVKVPPPFDYERWLWTFHPWSIWQPDFAYGWQSGGGGGGQSGGGGGGNSNTSTDEQVEEDGVDEGGAPKPPEKAPNEPVQVIPEQEMGSDVLGGNNGNEEGRPLTECEENLLSPYIPQEDLDNARIHDGEVPRYLPDDMVGITRKNDIYFRPDAYDSSTEEGIGLLGHELVHVGQYRNGANWLSFIWSYRNGYMNSKYEIPAYSMQSKIERDLIVSGKGGCP